MDKQTPFSSSFAATSGKDRKERTKKLQMQTLARHIKDRRLELKRQIAPSLARPKRERTEHDKLVVSQFRDWNRQTRHDFLKQLQSIPESMLSPKQARMLRRFRKEQRREGGEAKPKYRGPKPKIHHLTWKRVGSSKINPSDGSSSERTSLSSIARLYQDMEKLGISSNTPTPIPGLQSTASETVPREQNP